MKRSRMARGKQRSWNSTLRPRSRKQVKVYELRAPFVADFLARHPRCQAGFAHCTGEATTVNEAIRRSHGGARYPGEPGRRETAYHALCVNCHDYITTHPKDARRDGWEVR